MTYEVSKDPINHSNELCYYKEEYSVIISSLLLDQDKIIQKPFRQSYITPYKFRKSEPSILCFDFLFYATNFINYNEDKDQVLPTLNWYYQTFKEFTAEKKMESLEYINKIGSDPDNLKFNTYFKEFEDIIYDFWGDIIQKEYILELKEYFAYVVLDNYIRVENLPKDQR